MNNQLGMILTSINDASMAKALAKRMIEGHLAACVQISAPGTSMYRWQGTIEESEEYFLSIKTSGGRLNEAKQWLERHHPYDTPEIMVLEGRAADAYAAWVDASTAVAKNRHSEVKNV
ncbi:MAG: divalent-cation tolerance protein CutA [Mariprofundaceae bacterium]